MELNTERDKHAIELADQASASLALSLDYLTLDQVNPS